MQERTDEAMNQLDCLVRMHNLDADIQSNELNSVEKSILAVLQHKQKERTIDVSWLQSECTRIGFSSKEFSHGFVKLLIHGHLESRGEFTYVLADTNKRAGELSLGSVQTMAGSRFSPVPRKLHEGEGVFACIFIVRFCPRIQKAFLILKHFFPLHNLSLFFFNFIFICVHDYKLY